MGEITPRGDKERRERMEILGLRKHQCQPEAGGAAEQLVLFPKSASRVAGIVVVVLGICTTKSGFLPSYSDLGQEISWSEGLISSVLGGVFRWS